MPVLRFHAVGNWTPNQIRTRWENPERALPAEVRQVIDREWKLALSRPGVKLFDGPMCRLECWRANAGGPLELVLGPTSYKHFLGTNMRRPDLADRFGREVLANPVGVSAIVETSDGYLLLGRRNASVAYYPGRIHPFAGSLEPVDATGASAPDPFAAVRRELAEELSFTTGDVAGLRCTGLVEDADLRQPELIFRATTPLPRASVEASVARDEHHASVAAPATVTGLAELLQDPALTPVAVASLLLWGRHSFGPDWFARHAGRWT